ncbi:MAG: START domain-containing protein [Salibacteraceae bacterium]
MNIKITRDLNKLLFGSFLFLLIPFIGTAQKDWELAKSKNGIEVFTKDAPGWPIKAYFARGMVKVDYRTAMDYMLQLNKRKEWVQDCSASDVLHKEGDSISIVYFHIDTPWPTSDRDMVLKIMPDSNAEKGATFFRFEGMAHYIPEKEDIVRINKATGYWKVRYVDETMVEISTQGKSETGGDLPEWLANMFVTESPYQSIENLRAILGAPQSR